MSAVDVQLLKEKMEQVEKLKAEIQVLQEKVGLNTEVEHSQNLIQKLKEFSSSKTYDLNSAELAKLWAIEEKYRNISQLQRKFYYFEESHGARGIKKYASKFGLGGVFNNLGLTKEITPPDTVFIGEFITGENNITQKRGENDIMGYILKRTPGISTGLKTYRKIFEGIFTVVNTQRPHTPGKGYQFGHGQISDRFIKNGIGREYKFLEKEEINMMCFEGNFVNNEKNGQGEFYDLKEEVVVRGEWRDGEVVSTYTFNCPKVCYKEIEKYLTPSNEIGGGAFGRIYRIKSKNIPSLKKKVDGSDEVAVKIMKQHSQYIYEREMVARMMRRGIECCSKVNSEYVLKIYGIIIGSESCGYIMELGEKSVDKVIYNRTSRNSVNPVTQSVPVDTKIRWLYETAKGMASLHSKDIMHRDLKWSNILVLNNQMKITDFDTLKEEENEWRLEEILHTKQIGSTGFVAPEVFKGAKYGVECDVYSFAMMIYALLWQTPTPVASQKNCNCGAVVHDLLFTSNRLDDHVVRCGLRPKLDPSETKMYPKYLIDMMETCWQENPSCRPTFSEIVNIFESKLNIKTTEDQDYAFVTLIVAKKKNSSSHHRHRDHLKKKMLLSSLKEQDFPKFKDRIEKILSGSKVSRILLNMKGNREVKSFDEVLDNIRMFPEDVSFIIHLENTFMIDHNNTNNGDIQNKRRRRRMRAGTGPNQMIEADSEKDREIRRLRMIIEQNEIKKYNNNNSRKPQGRRVVRNIEEELEGEDEVRSHE